MTAEELWTQYQALLSEAEVVFYYSGSASCQRVEEAVRRVFARLLTPREAHSRCLVLAQPKGEVRRVTDVMDVTQGKLAMGFRTGVTMNDPRFPAMLVCNALYGGTAHSKLFMNVREKMSLCYFASSMIDKLKGLMMVISGVEIGDFDRAGEEILAQLECVQRGDFTQAELTAAIRAVVNGLISRKDSQSQLEDDIVTGALYCGQPADSQALIDAVESITAEQVSQAAKLIRLDTVYHLTGREEG